MAGGPRDRRRRGDRCSTSRACCGYSRSDTELATQASRDEARAAELRATAARLRASVDTKQIDAASVEARQANELIDRRTFSWTELFNRFETTLPPDVRITSVRPALDRDRRIMLTITVLARGVDDVNEFMERLEATGAFANLLSREERVTDTGQLAATLECDRTARRRAGEAAMHVSRQTVCRRPMNAAAAIASSRSIGRSSCHWRSRSR